MKQTKNSGTLVVAVIFGLLILFALMTSCCSKQHVCEPNYKALKEFQAKD